MEILNYINGGNYIIKIKGNYNYYELYENHNMLFKCEVTDWDNYLKYINSKESIKYNEIDNKFEQQDICFDDDKDDNHENYNYMNYHLDSDIELI